jgi:hypothetical protein
MARSRSIRRPEATTDNRSPEVRLEAFVREKYDDRAERMWARILDGLDAAPEPAPWISAARSLSERLIISEDAFYWFAESFTECHILHAAQHDAELRRLRDEMVAIERAHGLTEDQYWDPDQATDEWRALDEVWNQRADAIVNDALRASGNADIADARATDLVKYQRRVAKGGDELWNRGDEVPAEDD